MDMAVPEHTPAWYPDELAHAGPEHLDAAYVATYDRKAGFDPADDLAQLRRLGLDSAATLVDLGAGSCACATCSFRATSPRWTRSSRPGWPAHRLRLTRAGRAPSSKRTCATSTPRLPGCSSPCSNMPVSRSSTPPTAHPALTPPIPV